MLCFVCSVLSAYPVFSSVYVCIVVQSLPSVFVSHIKAGVMAAAQDPSALLIFSGTYLQHTQIERDRPTGIIYIYNIYIHIRIYVCLHIDIDYSRCRPKPPISPHVPRFLRHVTLSLYLSVCLSHVRWSDACGCRPLE